MKIDVRVHVVSLVIKIRYQTRNHSTVNKLHVFIIIRINAFTIVNIYIGIYTPV